MVDCLDPNTAHQGPHTVHAAQHAVQTQMLWINCSSLTKLSPTVLILIWTLAEPWAGHWPFKYINHFLTKLSLLLCHVLLLLLSLLHHSPDLVSSSYRRSERWRLQAKVKCCWRSHLQIQIQKVGCIPMAQQRGWRAANTGYLKIKD